MRLGAPVFGALDTPDAWAAAHIAKGYRAAYAPHIDPGDDALVSAYAAAAARADLVIAEVGAWSNPLSPDAAERAEAVALCRRALDYADCIGARCCVNISGSRGSVWDGPHPMNLTRETFGMIVDTVRRIIDEVKPRRAFYTLETMPYMFPDSAQSYLDLIRAVDRAMFAVHLDICNLISSVTLYEKNCSMIEEAVRLLGPRIRSVHVKDVALMPGMTLHISEVVCGRGAVRHRALIKALAALGTDLPLMLEHLADEAQYDEAAAHLRMCARHEGIVL